MTSKIPLMKSTNAPEFVAHVPLVRMGLIHHLLLVLYEVAWSLFIAGWLLFLLVRQGRNASEEITQRLGFVPCRPADDGGALWIHAVSVGELLSIRPVIDEIKRRSPTTWILLTTSNEAAYRLATSRPTGADSVSRTPWDSARCIRRALARCRPDKLAIVECEIWPNLIRLTAAQRRSVLMINARIYERDFPRYRLAKSVFQPILCSISGVYTQSSADRDRFLAIGMPAERVHLGGNTKFDAVPNAHPKCDDASLRKVLGIETGPLLILASTHEDEEKQIIEQFSLLRSRFQSLQLLIAPRDITRAEKIEAFARGEGFAVLRRSLAMSRPLRPDVILLDTLGELVLCSVGGM